MKKILTYLLLLTVFHIQCVHAQSPGEMAQQEMQKKFENAHRYKTITLVEKPEAHAAAVEKTIMPPNPLPVYGADTKLCFAVEEPFEFNEANFVRQGKLSKSIYKELFGEPVFPPREKEERFLTGTVTDKEGHTKSFGSLTLPQPVFTEVEKKIVHMAACAYVDPDSANEISLIHYTLHKNFKPTAIYWNTSNTRELIMKITIIPGDLDERVYLEDNSKVFKAEEQISYAPEQVLPVHGKSTELCFVVGQARSGSMDDQDKIIETILGKDDKAFKGSAMSSEGETYAFSSSLNSGWELKEFNTGDVRLCAQLIFGENDCCNCCGGAVSRNERLKEIDLPKDIKSLVFTPPVDIPASALYWNTSNRDESMRDTYQKAYEESKRAPFIPGPNYQRLAKIFPGDASQGSLVMDAQSLDLGRPDPHIMMERISGVFLSFSEHDFHITPKDQRQSKSDSVKINAKNIYACTARCFGSDLPWDAIFIIKEPEFYLEIKDGVEFVEWCWKNKIPVSSRRQIDSIWTLKKGPLPEIADDQKQFSSLKEYQKKINQACGGY